MSTRGINSKAWPRRVLAIIISSLCLVTSLSLTAATAGAAPGKNTTTTIAGSTGGGGGGGGGGGVANPKLTAVASLSRHRLLATYDRDLDAAALQPSSYAFYSKQAVNLPVTGVSRATNNQAYVLTGPQDPVTYEVKLPKTSRPITFTGSTAAEPQLLAVKSLSKTQIVVSFSEPVGTSALQPSMYQITVEGSSATLAVTGVAVFGSTGKEVLLTTAEQAGVPYVLKVGDIQGTSGTYIDPSASTLQFPGSTVPPGPMLVSATSNGGTQVILTFDSPLDPPSATNPANYTATPNLFFAKATLQSEGRQVVLETGQQYQLGYSIVANVKGANGNPVNPGFNSVSFTGTGDAISNERPKVVSAASTSNKSVVVQFSKPMADSTADPSRFVIVQTVVHPEVGALTITGAAFVDGARLSVRLTTLSQAEVSYQVTVNNVTDLMGNPLADKTNVAGVMVDPTSATFPGTPPTACPGNPPPGTVATNKTATLKGTGTTFRSTFKVGDAIRVAGETVRTIKAIASDASGDTSLTVTTAFTTEESGLAYLVSCPDEPVNSDTDTLYDHEETRGWQITIKLANGDTQVRQVTSSPFSDDSDGDALKDHEERALGIDPRDMDTDDDGLNDWMEFNEYYSDPTNQDSDKDGLFDGLEATFFLTSPIFDDTDGDQLKDGYEINVNRNPKVADLPQPILRVGEMRMGLDVRFIESNGTTTRQLDAKSVEASLVQSSSQQFGSSESTTHEVSSKLAQKIGSSVKAQAGLFAAIKAEKKFEFETNAEVSNTNSWTSEFTRSSSEATERAHTDSLTTEVEAARDATVTREVNGAQIQLAVSLESRGNVAFTAKNLQVAALISDPLDPARLTPIATLVPDTGLDTAFNLGPLVPPKGPIVFSSSTVYPQLVDDLMKNPRGLVFRFANYDILDEGGRNFAFTSQEINDRTARISIDYGGFDANGDGRGEDSEILRVATGVIGRHVVDTNKDGAINEQDRKVVFDLEGKQVGLTLRDALTAAGLKGYDESETPSSSLSLADRQRSYSTSTDADGVETLFRVRNRQIEPGSPRSWEIVTRNGIDYTLGLDDRILYPGTNVELMFLQDLDKDGLPALTEGVNGCIDSPAQSLDGTYAHRDTDGDGLDDRFEVLIGWEVDTKGHIGRVHSTCHSGDSDDDGLSDREEAPAVIKYDLGGLVLFDNGAAPRSVADLKTTSGSAVVTSASANFSPQDVGVTISGPGIPDNTTILSVQGSTEATMTANATATSSGVSASIGAWYTLANAPKRDVSGQRSVGDLTTTSGSPVVTSPSANFTALDVGKAITGGGIPASTTIRSVESMTQATMTADATAAGSGQAVLGDGFADYALHDPVTDPVSRDTDGDGLQDRFELSLYANKLGLPLRKTSPEHDDSDFDTMSDGVERRLEADPRHDDHLRFLDTDHDGLTDAQEIADDNNNAQIDPHEINPGAGWDVTVTRMHRPLASPGDPYSAAASINDGLPANARHLVTKGQRLQVGMIVDIKNEQSPEAPLNTSVDKIEPASGEDAYVTFGTAFTGAGQNVYRTVCKNGTCPAQHVTTTRHVYSSKHNVDTDGDGLTDFEEQKLKTDPGDVNDLDKDSDGDGVRDSWDTDDDGLSDVEEVRGFRLSDGTVVKTNPTNGDTDNDRRSDGDEAGRPGGEFIVRLPGGNLYQVITNPTKADGDFDGLVDGDEQVYAIDPTMPNTDKDNQSDYSEILAGRRPEVPDMKVTMNFVRLAADKDGEPAGDAGDFQFEFSAVMRDGSSRLVVHSGKTDVGDAPRLPLDQLSPRDRPTGDCPGDNWTDQCWHTTSPAGRPPQTIVRIHDLSSVPFTVNGEGRSVTIGSISTTDAVPEQFGIKGYVAEFDGINNDQLQCKVDIFPDIFGNAQDGTGLVKGSQLRLGTNSMAIHRGGINCGGGDHDLDFTLMVSYTAL